MIQIGRQLVLTQRQPVPSEMQLVLVPSERQLMPRNCVCVSIIPRCKHWMQICVLLLLIKTQMQQSPTVYLMMSGKR